MLNPTITLRAIVHHKKHGWLIGEYTAKDSDDFDYVFPIYFHDNDCHSDFDNLGVALHQDNVSVETMRILASRLVNAAPEPPAPKYKVGDRVMFTDDNTQVIGEIKWEGTVWDVALSEHIYSVFGIYGGDWEVKESELRRVNDRLGVGLIHVSPPKLEPVDIKSDWF